MAENATQYIPRVSTIGSTGVESAGGNDDWKAKQIKRLKARLLGEDEETKKLDSMERRERLETVERSRLDGLRSVAPAQKARMLNRFIENEYRRRRRFYWQEELNELLGLKD
ncbi:hypothetical protein [Nitratireductor sp. CH_MIT9313-5]|uniref:hypothetical protein n=1 Tax=Nitratireductor sp. CH_MIT9313-5 TaxID=3107764 RepID=UPI003009DC57